MSRFLFALILALPAQAQVLTRVSLAPAPVPGLFSPSSVLTSGLTPSLALSAPALTVTPLVVSPAPVALARVAIAAATPDAPLAASAVAYVLDLDGNAFGPGFPTKIILFKKGGTQELAVPTAHFAAIEKEIGKNFPYGEANLQDYELRGAESFREFFGPKFAADLKYAVENLPASEWQGPSWGAMVRALSDPRTAAQFYVLTARQHTSEQLLDGFKYLQAAGYIQYLPKVENLFGVGGTYRTAERKAELMAEFIDRLQAAPVGPDGALHTIGFSDDTWANYEMMRDALTAILRDEPGRWKNVKIVLFFTGSNDLVHPREAIVLNADGTTRPYVPGEPR